MQSVSSRIWTCVAVSISYDDNHYTTGTSNQQQLSDVHMSLYLKVTITALTNIIFANKKNIFTLFFSK